MGLLTTDEGIPKSMNPIEADRVSPTAWRICASDEWVDIVATAEGLEVDSELISWDDLADARRFFTMKEADK
jgi:hypothetical protein